MRVITKDTSVRDAGLSLRTHNLLCRNAVEFGIKVRFGEYCNDFPIGVMEGYDLSELGKIKGFGVATMQEIRKMLQRAGIQSDVENIKEDREEKNFIYFNRYTKEGKILYELASLLKNQDSEIVIK